MGTGCVLSGVFTLLFKNISHRNAYERAYERKDLMKCCDIVGATPHVKLTQINLMTINAQAQKSVFATILSK